MKTSSLASATLLDGLFRPRSVAVVGASRSPNSIGRVILQNLLRGGFQGPVYPVNPKADYVQSIRSFKTVSAIPDPVDLVVVVVPKDLVLGVVKDCAKKKVKGLVVITAGFKETGDKGAKAEGEIRKLVRKHGMRLIGPNCMGIINTAPEFSMNATFAASAPRRGNVGFMTQSGALGEAILAHAGDLHLGLSMFASMGNKADVSGNDILEYMEKDKNTDLILMYLESFGNPRTFTSLAKRISRTKPIVAVKAGKTVQGARAVASHTGSMAGVAFASDALFEQCGVIQVPGIECMFDVAQLLAQQPLPKGGRVGILTNSGGPGILATDALVRLGLDMATLSGSTVQKLKKFLPAEASIGNPVDMIASANPEKYRKALEIMLRDKNIDILLAIFTPPIMINVKAVATAIAEVSQNSPIPMLTCFMGTKQGAEAVQILRSNHVPVYAYPESAAHAIALVDRYRRWKARPTDKAPRFRVNASSVSRMLQHAVKTNKEFLDFEEAKKLFEAYGIKFAPSKIVKRADAAIAAAEKLGLPVALKVASGEVVHKTEAGGVRVGLKSVDEVWKAYQDIQKRFAKKLKVRQVPVLVQRMIEGREVVFGMSNVGDFGPVLMFGLGGIYVEVLKDVSFGVAPLTPVDAHDMIKNIRSFKLLTGVRGQKAVDIPALENYLLRLSQMVAVHGQIESFDLNPVMVTERGAYAVDARVVLRADTQGGPPARRMTAALSHKR